MFGDFFRDFWVTTCWWLATSDQPPACRSYQKTSGARSATTEIVVATTVVNDCTTVLAVATTELAAATTELAVATTELAVATTELAAFWSCCRDEELRGL